MSQETQIHLVLLSELVLALLVNDPDTFKRWLLGGIQDLGVAAVEDLFADWLLPLLMDDEVDRLIAWNLGVRL